MPNVVYLEELQDGFEMFQQAFGKEITVRNPRMRVSDRNASWYTLVDEYVESIPILAIPRGGKEGTDSYDFTTGISRVSRGRMRFYMPGGTKISSESYVMWEGQPRSVESVTKGVMVSDIPVYLVVTVNL